MDDREEEIFLSSDDEFSPETLNEEKENVSINRVKETESGLLESSFGKIESLVLKYYENVYLKKGEPVRFELKHQVLALLRYFILETRVMKVSVPKNDPILDELLFRIYRVPETGKKKVQDKGKKYKKSCIKKGRSNRTVRLKNDKNETVFEAKIKFLHLSFPSSDQSKLTKLGILTEIYRKIHELYHKKNSSFKVFLEKRSWYQPSRKKQKKERKSPKRMPADGKFVSNFGFSALKSRGNPKQNKFYEEMLGRKREIPKKITSGGIGLETQFSTNLRKIGGPPSLKLPDVTKKIDIFESSNTEKIKFLMKQYNMENLEEKIVNWEEEKIKPECIKEFESYYDEVQELSEFFEREGGLSDTATHLFLKKKEIKKRILIYPKNLREELRVKEEENRKLRQLLELRISTTKSASNLPNSLEGTDDLSSIPVPEEKKKKKPKKKSGKKRKKKEGKEPNAPTRESKRRKVSGVEVPKIFLNEGDFSRSTGNSISVAHQKEILLCLSCNQKIEEKETFYCCMLCYSTFHHLCLQGDESFFFFKCKNCLDKVVCKKGGKPKWLRDALMGKF